MTAPLLAVALSPGQTIVVLVLGMLLFGKRLPEISRSVARGLLEFRKGLSGIEEDIAAGLTRHERPRSAPAPQFILADAPGAGPSA